MSARIVTPVEAKALLDAVPLPCPATTTPCECYAGRTALEAAAGDLAATVASETERLVAAFRAGAEAAHAACVRYVTSAAEVAGLEAERLDRARLHDRACDAYERQKVLTAAADALHALPLPKVTP